MKETGGNCKPIEANTDSNFTPAFKVYKGNPLAVFKLVFNF